MIVTESLRAKPHALNRLNLSSASLLRQFDFIDLANWPVMLQMQAGQTHWPNPIGDDDGRR
ncbi:hypothetical protein, partial [Mesorhizobium sp. M2E.F.Ca.ET.209.01.1.1]|uniref:hypothetical protein n=1 Tax=Mesorhizobium sp. M2E.F.Ca.ET.209.01.1.1 TaxID=2500526 RepID=UPI001AEE56AE